MGNPVYLSPKRPPPPKTQSYVQLRLSPMQGSGGDVFYKMKRRVPMSMLVHAYCARADIEEGDGVEFIYRGAVLPRTKTPEELRMKDVEYIQVVEAGRPARSGASEGEGIPVRRPIPGLSN